MKISFFVAAFKLGVLLTILSGSAIASAQANMECVGTGCPSQSVTSNAKISPECIGSGCPSQGSTEDVQSNAVCKVRDRNIRGTYEGGCIAGFASGKGRAIGKDQYEGGFRNGLATGYGVYTNANGQRVEGEFLDGKLNGKAKIYYASGEILEGQFSIGILVGTGKLTTNKGGVFDVVIRDGKVVRADTANQKSLSPSMPSNTAASEMDAPKVKWTPLLNHEDIFPSYILSSATRKEPDLPYSPPKSRTEIKAEALLALADILQSMTSGKKYQNPLSTNSNYIGDQFGVVGVAVRSVEPNTEVVVAISIDGVAERTAERFKLDGAGEYMLYPKLKFDYEKLRNITQPIPVNVSWSLTINGKPAGAQIRAATLRSVNDAPIQVQTARGLHNLSWVFAAYVTEDAPWIDLFLKDVLQKGQVQQFTGYQTGTKEVYRQVGAIYAALQRRGIKYSNIATSSQSSDRVFSQVVRFPSDSVKNAQANCIDGTVLMASILQKIGLDAYIILGPGHAMLGFSNTGDLQQGISVVETTMIGNGSFQSALQAGAATYNEWIATSPPDPRFQLIRISDERQKGVMPIAR